MRYWITRAAEAAVMIVGIGVMLFTWVALEVLPLGPALHRASARPMPRRADRCCRHCSGSTHIRRRMIA